MADGFVQAVIRAHRWWDKGELTARIGAVPEALARGIEVWDSAINAGQSWDIRHPPDRPEVRPQAMAHGHGVRVVREPAHRRRRGST